MLCCRRNLAENMDAGQAGNLARRATALSNSNRRLKGRLSWYGRTLRHDFDQAVRAYMTAHAGVTLAAARKHVYMLRAQVHRVVLRSNPHGMLTARPMRVLADQLSATASVGVAQVRDWEAKRLNRLTREANVRVLEEQADLAKAM